MAVLDTGSSTAGKANVDSNYNLQVNLPTTPSQAGYVTLAGQVSSGVARPVRVSDDNAMYNAEARQVLDIDFNSASTAWAGKIGTNATTMTKAVTNGAMRLNSGASAATTVGISIYSNRVITLEAGYDYRVKMQVKHTNATATNKQADLGLGYYNFAAGQANAMNEFIGFRWTTTGGLLAVLETTQGGAPTTYTANVNSNLPYSDNVFREYEVVVTTIGVDYYVDNVWVARLDKEPGSWGVVKATSLPFIARVFNSGAASAAMTLDIGMVCAFKIGADDGQSHPARMAAMDKSSYYAQPDIIAAATATHNVPASGTAPTAATATNAASVLNNAAQMGGFFRMNGATITATAHSNFLVAAYQNPAYPTAAGQATNARNFYVTGITVSPMVVTTVLVGGAFTALWYASIGATAISTGATDADGTTAVAQKADRLVPLSRMVTFGAAAAVGTVETGVGDNTVQFATPLVIHPGEFLKVGLRTIWVNALVSSGTIDGAIMVNGYWD